MSYLQITSHADDNIEDIVRDCVRLSKLLQLEVRCAHSHTAACASPDQTLDEVYADCCTRTGLSPKPTDEIAYEQGQEWARDYIATNWLCDVFNTIEELRDEYKRNPNKLTEGKLNILRRHLIDNI